jgi:hypothetical protein
LKAGTLKLPEGLIDSHPDEAKEAWLMFGLLPTLPSAAMANQIEI